MVYLIQSVVYLSFMTYFPAIWWLTEVNVVVYSKKERKKEINGGFSHIWTKRIDDRSETFARKDDQVDIPEKVPKVIRITFSTDVAFYNMQNLIPVEY